MLKYDSHVPTSEYVNCVFSHYFYPTINRPTRITEMSATLIDNITTNDNQIKYIPTILYADVSDHLPVLIQTDLVLKKHTEKFFYRRSFTENAKLKFTELLQSANWEEIITSNMDPNTAYTDFNKAFLHIYEVSFPLKKSILLVKELLGNHG